MLSKEAAVITAGVSVWCFWIATFPLMIIQQCNYSPLPDCNHASKESNPLNHTVALNSGLAWANYESVSIFNDFRFEHQSLLIFSWEHISEHHTVVNSMRYLSGFWVHCVHYRAPKVSTTVLSVFELFVSRVKRILTYIFSERN